MTTDLFDLTGRVALVTGSTRGIGRAIAEELARAGAAITVSSESAADTAATAAALAAAGAQVLGQPCDVTSDDAVAALVDATVARFGRLDILVGNAGIAGVAGSWATADFDRVMAVNLRSAIVLCERALPHLAAGGAGSAVLVSSISGLRGNAGINAYALSKAALVQLARNLAVQWGPRGVRVNAVSPGLIRTDFSLDLLADDAFRERRLGMTPLRRAGEVGDVAGAVRFLAAPAAAFVTGHNLVVDGGTVVTDGS